MTITELQILNQTNFMKYKQYMETAASFQIKVMKKYKKYEN